MAEQGKRRKVVTTKFGVLSMAKVLGVIYVFGGIIYSVILALLFLFEGIDATWPKVLVPIVIVMLTPIIMGISGFVSGLIFSLIYNFVAPRVGGIEYEEMILSES